MTPPPAPPLSDGHWMRRALELAQRGRGRVEPNPMVGAVIVRNDRLVGEGYHERFGGPHAEVNAMRAAGDACAGATLYVTLSPCTGQHKKTPPCCNAVVRARFARVVIGAEDPTQEPARPRLEDAGIQATVGVLGDACRRLIAPFLKLRQQRRPWIIAKWAMTADGKIAAVSGDSKWISCESSRRLVHQWRNEVDAILVGAGTVRKDDPLLTCRMPGGRNPRRIVLDSRASLPLHSRLVASVKDAPLVIACAESASDPLCKALKQAGCAVRKFPAGSAGVDIDAVLDHLGGEELTNVMVEGGGTVLASFFARGLVDEVRIFVAPKIIGGAAAPTPVEGEGLSSMTEALHLDRMTARMIGDDLLIEALVAKPKPPA